MKLAPMFCNNVVLLRDSECNIWGESNTDVIITIDGTTVRAESVNGKFTAKLKPHSAGGPYTLKAEGDGEIIELEFIVVAENGTTAVGEYEINGDTVKVKAEGVIPAEVRFAFKGWGEVFLYNSIGMPSSPFRIKSK